jgi:aspartate/glutamate racemase
MREMIVPNYISQDKVKQIIYNKYKKGNFNIKSPQEMERYSTILHQHNMLIY